MTHIKKILLTGGAGFLGSHLSKKLLDKKYKVLCVDNFYSSSKSNIANLLDNPNFNFEISPLMENAMSECDGWWCKYNVDHQEIAEEDFGDDEDEEAHWEAYEDAFDNISNSVDTSSFEKLSKIVL